MTRDSSNFAHGTRVNDSYRFERTNWWTQSHATMASDNYDSEVEMLGAASVGSVASYLGKGKARKHCCVQKIII
jgi:hypothetical protein